MAVTSKLKAPESPKLWPPSLAPRDEVVVAHYEKPVVTPEKQSMQVVKTPYASCTVQVFSEGGENNLHSHPMGDGFWFVKSGRVRFYTTGDELVVELGENEGFVTPRRYMYWFESVPEAGDLELIRFGAYTRSLAEMAPGAGRVNHEEIKENQTAYLRTKDELAFDLLKTS